MNIDVTDTAISCYSGCLTSSEILITGASDDCHNGSIMKQFIIICGFGCVVVLVSTCSMRYLNTFIDEGGSVRSVWLSYCACIFTGIWAAGNEM